MLCHTIRPPLSVEHMPSLSLQELLKYSSRVLLPGDALYRIFFRRCSLSGDDLLPRVHLTTEYMPHISPPPAAAQPCSLPTTFPVGLPFPCEMIFVLLNCAVLRSTGQHWSILVSTAQYWSVLLNTAQICLVLLSTAQYSLVLLSTARCCSVQAAAAQ